MLQEMLGGLGIDVAYSTEALEPTLLNMENADSLSAVNYVVGKMRAASDNSAGDRHLTRGMDILEDMLADNIATLVKKEPAHVNAIFLELRASRQPLDRSLAVSLLAKLHLSLAQQDRLEPNEGIDHWRSLIQDTDRDVALEAADSISHDLLPYMREAVASGQSNLGDFAEGLAELREMF